MVLLIAKEVELGELLEVFLLLLHESAQSLLCLHGHIQPYGVKKYNILLHLHIRPLLVSEKEREFLFSLLRKIFYILLSSKVHYMFVSLFS